MKKLTIKLTLTLINGRDFLFFFKKIWLWDKISEFILNVLWHLQVNLIWPLHFWMHKSNCSVFPYFVHNMLFFNKVIKHKNHKRKCLSRQSTTECSCSEAVCVETVIFIVGYIYIFEYWYNKKTPNKNKEPHEKSLRHVLWLSPHLFCSLEEEITTACLYLTGLYSLHKSTFAWTF